MFVSMTAADAGGSGAIVFQMTSYPFCRFPRDFVYQACICACHACRSVPAAVRAMILGTYLDHRVLLLWESIRSLQKASIISARALVSGCVI